MSDPNDTNLSPLVAEVVAAYVANHQVEAGELPDLIQRVYQSFLRLNGHAGAVVSGTRPDPAVSVRKSVTPEYLVCLEDGKKLKMLKRHLKSTYNLTPDQYRERWGLPADYPMVAPNYAKQRSRLAKQSGLGTKGRPVT
jgi:predicted transcriptional regulator